MKRLTRNFIIFLMAMSILIFVVGVFEVIRNQYMFSIVEDNLLNAGETPTDIYNYYLTFKNNLLFTNSFFVTFINWIGILSLFYIFLDSAREGYNTAPYLLKEIFLKFNLILIMFVYVVVIVFNYLTELFINDLIIVLFNDIYESVYIFKIFNEFFIWLFLFGVFINWFFNQVKHFEVFNS